MTALRWIGAALGTMLVVVAIILGGWRLGWWMQAKAVNYQNHIYQHSYGAQSAYVEQLDQAARDVAGIDVQIRDPHTPPAEVASLRAQRTAVANQACDVASRITEPLPPNLAEFVGTNCEGTP